MAEADVLFIHNNFPGQLGFIATALKQRGLRCMAIGSQTAKSAEIPVRNWTIPSGTSPGLFPLATRMEADLIRGHAAAEQAIALRDEGFDPLLIVGHPGWGETSLMMEIFPKARQILHGELYYNSEGGDAGFDPEFGALTQEDRFRIAAKNATMAMAYLEADRIVSPTPFQAASFPKTLRRRMSVIHEGVDIDAIKPRVGVTLEIKDGPTLDRSTPVVTFINRHFEPLRGYHVFMRALPAFMAARPDAHIVMIGGDEGRGYGMECKTGTWKETYLAEVRDRIDMKRIHFVGKVAHNWMLNALNISAAHVYYTYPFVLSWSLLEAMATECLVLGSDTAPVRDVIQDGVNGRLLDFFDPAALSRALVDACERPQDFTHLRKAARKTIVEGYDQKRICRPAWLTLIDEVMALGPR
jgi:glycosyltransferase involved in cell wall biosynthesis